MAHNGPGREVRGQRDMHVDNTKAMLALRSKQRPTPYARPAASGPKPGLALVAAATAIKPGSPKEQVPVNDLVQLARQAFSQKDFAAATQFLSRALTIAPKDINLLDSRAASLERLGSLSDALADAKAMIKNHPQHPKGYLRAAKIFRLQQNYKSSTKLYVAGAERCDKGSKEYETLARMATEMAAKMEDIVKKEARILDPMERLPFELIMIIFSSLTFTERVRCLTISKKWMQYLGSVKQFWLSIDLAKRSPSTSQTPHYAAYAPVQVDQEPNNKVSNKTVLSLVKYTSPKALRLGCAQFVTGALLKDLTNMGRAGALETLSVRMNHKIYEQDFSRFWSATPRLCSLDLHGCYGVTDRVVFSFLDRCPQLEELDISECGVTEACVMVNGNIPFPSMKKLTIGRWETQFAKEGIDALASRFPNLNTLDIRSMRPRGIEALENICQLTQLKHLYTEAIETSSDATTIFVVQRWVEGISELESLQMNACKGVSDAILQLIAAGSGGPGSTRRGWSQSLRMLDLSSSPYLTCDGLSFLRTHPLPRLHTLILNKCGRVSEFGLQQAVMSCGAELRRFECAGYLNVSDRLMEDIKKYCPKIAMVHAAHSGMITGIGLMALVNERARGLERICVDDCPALRVDAVERARTVLGENARVSYRFHRSHR
ncbi:hypothetical protein EDD11_002845 [Mortierella claussenii]|nr:hypothetical protein EDD11_002845 [Mortierella claussenii]